MKRKVKNSTRCCDSLIEIAGEKFLGVPSERCTILEGQMVEILAGPIEVSHSGGNIVIVKTRHMNSKGEFHVGWSLNSDLEDPAI